MANENIEDVARRLEEELRRVAVQERPAEFEADRPEEDFIADEEIEIITEKHVCVFWSNKDADRTSVAGSVENPYHKTSSQYDSCSSPDMDSDAALPMCNYEIMAREDTEQFCPFYKAEDSHKILETENGQVCTTRILDFDEMTMTRVFLATTSDGTTTEHNDPAVAFEKIR